jgi:ketosteroid isomerase-like protein
MMFATILLLARLAAPSATLQIVTLEQQWLAALERHDAQFFTRVLDDDLTQIGLAGERAGKSEFLRFFEAGDWTYVESRLENPTITMRRDWAIATGRVWRVVRVGDVTTRGAFDFTHVWVRKGSTWRVIHIHLTSRPGATP